MFQARSKIIKKDDVSTIFNTNLFATPNDDPDFSHPNFVCVDQANRFGRRNCQVPIIIRDEQCQLEGAFISDLHQ